MAYHGVHEDVLRCAKLEIPSRVPCFPIGVMYDFHHLGYSHRTWRERPEIMVDVGVRAVREFDYDIYMLHPDDLLEYEDIGIGIRFDDEIPPAVERYLVPEADVLGSFRLPDERAFKKGRLAAYLEGIRGLKREFGDSVLLVGRVAAPFTTMSVIFGIEASMFLMLENPGFFRNCEDFFLEYNSIVAEAILEAGADAIWLGDCVATSYFISPAQFQDLAASYAAELSTRLRKRKGIVFYHGGEISIPHLEIAATLPFDTVNVGYGVDLARVKAAIGKRMCVMGNLDTILDLGQKPEAEVFEITGRMVEAGKEGGGYIFCTGEGVVHSTPVGNIHAMVRAVREHGRYGRPDHGSRHE